jgi:ABC-type Na+ efflux pump permease subunit
MSENAQDDASGAATPEAGEAEAAEAPEATPEADELEDVKRKFREALNRKNQSHAKDSASTGGKGTGKAQFAHGPASTRRSFRRKSG